MALSSLPTRAVLYFLMAIMMVDALIEMSFIAATVAYLHRDHPMNVRGDNGQAVILKGKPAGMMVDQGHTSNGAAGTALILVGIVGFLLLTLRGVLQRVFPRLYMALLTTWVVLCVLSFLLTTGALGYTFNVTNSTSGQVIDLSGLSSPIRYPKDKWVPQTWYGAILDDLHFIPTDSDSVVVDGASIPWATRGDIARMKRITNGWKWNLVPLFVLQLFVTPLIVHEYLTIRREGRVPIPQQERKGDV
ncbi:uncharacterized protein PV09_08094 [Verruconis gallopava]|uniref:Uncharacterized protein n=1 Tax=Verruconis gallopava TaxID=253628 RepID=A0A0D2A232_9PEZI|nr:uncharacterized protein PV09_08094 [Verruconis gallopava]KIW00385.1 hypothetical protein PV09_08094 [Verruconis gallopava]